MSILWGTEKPKGECEDNEIDGGAKRYRRERTWGGILLKASKQLRRMVSPSLLAAMPDSLTHLSNCWISPYFSLSTSCRAALQ